MLVTWKYPIRYLLHDPTKTLSAPSGAKRGAVLDFCGAQSHGFPIQHKVHPPFKMFKKEFVHLQPALGDHSTRLTQQAALVPALNRK